MSKHDLKFIVGVGAVLLSLSIANSYWRSSGYEPKYLAYVSDRVKELCLNEAKQGDNNVGFLGGADAKYFVALENCVREHDPGALEQVR